MASEIQALNSLNNKAQDTDLIRIFILCLIRFVQKFYDNQELKIVIEKILLQKQADLKKALKLREKTEKKLNDIHKKYLNYCISKQITPTDFWFEAYSHPDPKKRIYSTRDIVVEKHGILESLLLNLAETSTEHYEFVSHFAIITLPLSEKYHQRLNVILRVPIYHEWLEAERNLLARLPTLIWHHWDSIYCIYLAGTNKNPNLSPDDQNNPFKRWEADTLRERTQKAINSQNNLLYGFDLSSLKYSLDLILDFTKTVVTSNQTTTSEIPDLPMHLSFDETTQILSYRGKQLTDPLEKESIEADLCFFFFPAGKPMPDQVYWEDITLEHGDKVLEHNKQRDQLQKAKQRVNQKAGIEVIKSKKGYYRINPDLLS